MKKFFLLVTLLNYFVFYSQSIEGEVFNSEKELLSMVSVQLFQNEKLITYTSTNSKGYFELKAPEGTYTLVVNHWNHQKKSISVTLPSTEKKQIFLEKKIIELGEVVVNSKALLVKRKGDTLSYNLQGLTNGREENLKQVLDKLPGIKVDPVTGKISANGKEIDDLLINGQKLFGNNHRMATENIQAQMLDEIDLISNYETFSPLKNIQGSDRMALNVRIKKEFFGRITGDIQGFGGYKNKYQFHAKLFQFNQKASFSLITDANNIAQEPMSVFDFIELSSGGKADLRNSGSLLKSLNHSVVLPAFTYGDRQVKQKHNAFLSFYSVMQPSKSWTINAYAIGNQSNTDEEILSKRIFYNEARQITDAEQNNLKAINIITNVNSDYYLGKNSLLNYSFRFSKGNQPEHSEILHSENDKSLFYNNLDAFEKQTIGQQLSLITKLNRKSLISLNAFHQWEQSNTNLEVNFAQNDVFSSEIQQKINRKNNEFGVFSKYILKIGKEVLNAHLGWNYIFQKADYHKDIIYSENLMRNYFYLNALLLRKKTDLEYGLKAEVRSYPQFHEIVFLPEVLGRYNFKKDTHYLEGIYSRLLQFPQLASLNKTEYWSDFQTLYVGSQVAAQTQFLNDFFKLKYNYTNYFHGIDLEINSEYSANHKVISVDNSFFNGKDILTRRITDGGFSWENSANFEVSVFPIKQKIEFYFSVDKKRVYYFWQGEKNRNDTQGFWTSVDVKSRFKTFPIEYVFGAEFGKDFRKMNGIEQNSYENWRLKADITAKITPKIKAEFQHNFHYFSFSEIREKRWELNYKISYEPKSEKWSCFILAENFLNLKGTTLFEVEENDYYQQVFSRAILPGFIGVGIKYKFK